MKTELANDPSHERYVVEIDGIAKAEYCVFVKALRVGLRLKQEFPNSNVKLRESYEKAPLRATEPAIVTSSPSSIRVMPSAATTRV
jgi:hypothetical protein